MRIYQVKELDHGLPPFLTGEVSLMSLLLSFEGRPILLYVSAPTNFEGDIAYLY